MTLRLLSTTSRTRDQPCTPDGKQTIHVPSSTNSLVNQILYTEDLIRTMRTAILFPLYAASIVVASPNIEGSVAVTCSEALPHGHTVDCKLDRLFSNDQIVSASASTMSIRLIT